MNRLLIAAGGGILGILMTVALLIGGAEAIRGRESAGAADFVLETPDLGDMSETPDSDIPAEVTVDAGESPPDL